MPHTVHLCLTSTAIVNRSSLILQSSLYEDCLIIRRESFSGDPEQGPDPQPVQEDQAQHDGGLIAEHT